MRALEQQNPLLQLNVLVHTRHSVQFNQILARLNPKFLLNLIEVTQFNAVSALLLQAKSPNTFLARTMHQFGCLSVMANAAAN